MPHHDKSTAQAADEKKMSEKESAESEKVVNWNPPSKLELVERALEDGTTDPKSIVVFAEQHDVKMTVEEVHAIVLELKKKGR